MQFSQMLKNISFFLSLSLSFSSFFLSFIVLWYWDMNSGLHACKLALYHHFALYILEVDCLGLCAQAGLEL
jgi:hypothetical protein